MHHIVHHTHCNTCITYVVNRKKEIKPRRGHHRLPCWSGYYYLWTCRRARSAVSDWSQVYRKPTSIKKHENEGTERLMIGTYRSSKRRPEVR
jgi:hypothetical protein